VSPTILEGESALKFLVSDTGEGIDDEVKKRIFDPFFTTKTSGSGLGLALVYQMVKSHQGQVGVESRRGEGAKFWFELYKEGPKQKISEEGSSASAA
jgi:two-component system sensor histidine kinase HydH